MKVLFRESYEQDLGLFQDNNQKFRYFLLLCLAVVLPFILGDFFLGEATLFLIWAIGGMSLMILVGHTGLASLGHAAFLAIGAYTTVLMQTKLGIPFLLSLILGGLLSSLVGVIIAIPSTRLHSIYIAIITLAIAILVDDIIVLSESLTGGVSGIYAPKIVILGVEFDRYSNIDRLYWLVLIILITLVLIYKNILRSPLGRAFIAVRDSEISAAAMGINVKKAKILSFAVSCFYGGICGGLMGHFSTVFNNETFNLLVSINLLLMIVVGGLGSIHGAFFGAAILSLLPVFIAIIRDGISSFFDVSFYSIPGLETFIFCLMVIFCILYEPMGINGLWQKIRLFWELFPLGGKTFFSKQKSFLKTDRLK